MNLSLSDLKSIVREKLQTNDRTFVSGSIVDDVHAQEQKKSPFRMDIEDTISKVTSSVDCSHEYDLMKNIHTFSKRDACR